MKLDYTEVTSLRTHIFCLSQAADGMIDLELAPFPRLRTFGNTVLVRSTLPKVQSRFLVDFRDQLFG